MDKLEIKKQIEKLKEDLVQHKDKYKRMNESFKKHIADLQKQAANQSNKESSARIKSQIASKKHSWENNEKRFEREGTEKIKRDIERLKERLK